MGIAARLVAPLLTSDFWSRLSFLVSYVVASLLVLEVLRLVYTDANKREVEKMLDNYTRPRVRRGTTPPARQKISIDDLEQRMSRTPSPAATPASQRTLVNDQPRRKVSPARGTAAVPHVQAQSKEQTPPRRLRKRSDTLNSSGSSGSARRRREASPTVSSRHVSPTPAPEARERSKEAQRMGRRLEKMLRTKA